MSGLTFIVFPVKRSSEEGLRYVERTYIGDALERKSTEATEMKDTVPERGTGAGGRVGWRMN